MSGFGIRDLEELSCGFAVAFPNPQSRIPNPGSQYSTRLRSVPGIAASFAFSALAWASSALTSITT